jgi:hypothetical protein
MTETDMPPLLTQREYARYRRCSIRTIERERADGRGCPYIRLGDRILYRRADIERYLDAHRRGGETGSSGYRGEPASVARDPQVADKSPRQPSTASPERRRGRPRTVVAPDVTP